MSSEKDNLALSLWYLIKTASKQKKQETENLCIAQNYRGTIPALIFKLN